jgi:hypothetical protein
MELQGDAHSPAKFRRQLTEPASRALAAEASRRHHRLEEQTVTKFIQICASQDDLFALDEEGNVHQYNFNAQTWVKLVSSRAHEESPEESGR